MNEFPIDRIRDEFPALHLSDAGQLRVHLDNPAGTQVPRRVADAISRCLIESNANLGGYFSTTVSAGHIVEAAHDAMSCFLGAESPREIVIGQNMTTLTFQLSRSLARRFDAGDEVIVTRMDHDGNISPWLVMAEERRMKVRWLPFNRETWRIEPEALDEVLSDRTRILALNYASNLTGSINDVAALTAKARMAGALVFVDAVQFAPHGLIDVQALGCDFLVCSSYKFFGPHLGILWARESLLREMYAYKVRPATDDLSWKFETGTPQIESQAGLAAAIEYFEWLGVQSGSTGSRRRCIAGAFEAASLWEHHLCLRLIQGLQAIPGVTIHGVTNSNRIEHRVPTVSFTHTKVPPSLIAEFLARTGIFVWSGNNYALELVRSLGLSEEEGALRIGIGHYNTIGEIERTLAAVTRMLN